MSIKEVGGDSNMFLFCEHVTAKCCLKVPSISGYCVHPAAEDVATLLRDGFGILLNGDLEDSGKGEPEDIGFNMKHRFAAV